MVYSSDYVYQQGLVYKAGIVQPESVRIQSIKPIGNKIEIQNSQTLSRPATTNVVMQPVCYAVDVTVTADGRVVQTYRETYCVDYDGGGSPDTGGGDNGGGWGGGGSGGSSGGGTPTTVQIGKFRINPAYQIIAPKLFQTLQNIRSLVENNPTVLNALMEYSNRTKEQIIGDLQYGRGPEVVIGQPTDANGKSVIGGYSPASNTIILDGSFINQFEHTTAPLTNQVLSLYLSIVLLHEYNHYGDNLNGRTFPGDPGTAFEMAVFGVEVNPSTVPYLVDFLKR